MPSRIELRLCGSTATVGSSKKIRSGFVRDAAGDVQASQQTAGQFAGPELAEVLESGRIPMDPSTSGARSVFFGTYSEQK